MRVLVLGATGRVGSEIARLAFEAGHEVTAYVRNPAKLKAPDGVKVVVGELASPEGLTAALSAGFDAVLNAIGPDPLKASTLVTDTARLAIGAMKTAGVARYIAVSGTANMPRKTLFGKLTAALMSLTPVKHAIRDHRGAFALIQASRLDWTLAGCPWIKDGGEARHDYRQSDVFAGGFKTILPGDVAHFLVSTIGRQDYSGRIVCIWNG